MFSVMVKSVGKNAEVIRKFPDFRKANNLCTGKKRCYNDSKVKQGRRKVGEWKERGCQFVQVESTKPKNI